MGIGLVLSGGGAKGMAHIGVIAALIDYGINIEYISGCSSGSIIAALYACGYTPSEMLNIVRVNHKRIVDFDKTVGFKLIKTVFTKKINIKGFVKGNNLEGILRHMLLKKGIKDIQEVKFPLAIPAVKLKTGEITYFVNEKKIQSMNVCNMEETIKENDITEKTYELSEFDDFPSCISSGDLADIVRASCSFPGVFTPKTIENFEYIDGGVRVNTPVRILKEMGALKTIAVTFDCNSRERVLAHNFIGITEQAFNLLSHSSNESEQNLADVNLRLCINNVSLLDFSKTPQLVKRGYNLVARNIVQIKRRLNI